MVVVEVSATGRGESELCRPATDPAISSGRHLKFWSPSPDCVSENPDICHVWILRMFAKGGNESLGSQNLVLHLLVRMFGRSWAILPLVDVKTGISP